MESNNNSVINATAAASMMTCSSCKVSYDNPADQRTHYKTDLHRYNVKRKAAGLSPLSLSAFEAIVPEESAQPEHTETEHLEEDISESAASKAEPNSLGVDECIYCTSTYPNTKLVLEHMKANHPFFNQLPYAEDLNDVAGFVDAVRQLIGIDHSCLTCERRFENKNAVRKHMIDKGHTSIIVENLPDLWKFYTFASDDDDDDDDDDDHDVNSSDEEDAVVEDPKVWMPSENATSSELTLPSGVRVGHRNHRAPRNKEAKESSTQKGITDTADPPAVDGSVTRTEFPGYVAAPFKRQAFQALVAKQRHDIQLGLNTNLNNNAWCSGGRIITVKCKVSK